MPFYKQVNKGMHQPWDRKKRLLKTLRGVASSVAQAKHTAIRLTSNVFKEQLVETMASRRDSRIYHHLGVNLTQPHTNDRWGVVSPHKRMIMSKFKLISPTQLPHKCTERVRK